MNEYKYEFIKIEQKLKPGQKFYYKLTREECEFVREDDKYFYLKCNNEQRIINKNMLGKSLFFDKNHIGKISQTDYIKLYEKKIYGKYWKNTNYDKIKHLYFEDYHPERYMNEMNPKHNNNLHSVKLLNLKKGIPEYEYFYKILEKTIDFSNKELAIIIFPSSIPNNYGELYTIINKLCKKYNLVDTSKCLKRIRQVNKSHQGFRNVEKHFSSIELINKDLLINKNILIIDDIATSGNSLMASKHIIDYNDIKYKEIIFLALGKTVYYKERNGS